jgi:hypothetical protein
MQQETQQTTLQKVFNTMLHVFIKVAKRTLYYLIVAIEFICLKIQLLFVKLGILMQPIFQRAEKKLLKSANEFFGL